MQMIGGTAEKSVSFRVLVWHQEHILSSTDALHHRPVSRFEETNLRIAETRYVGMGIRISATGGLGYT